MVGSVNIYMFIYGIQRIWNHTTGTSCSNPGCVRCLSSRLCIYSAQNLSNAWNVNFHSPEVVSR